ncbi:MAG: orotidine-5'-phosphate decarboxylase [Candidatus Omnitrophica bacterium]|nr:orotidine-5'-phosphate decarboxylase [Candidatus Omnitrophota bacterium]
MNRLSDKIIVALDVPTLKETEKLLQKLQGVVSYYKVGFELFTAHGWKAVELVKKYNAKVFLDLKLHDIPNTAARTAKVICEHEVDMFNVHALGGGDMMKAVRKSVDEYSGKKPVVIAVTLLTSHDEKTVKTEIGIQNEVLDAVIALAKLTQESGLAGVVCSPEEISAIRKSLGQDFILVTPGIRPQGSQKGDQKRTLTPQEALKAGSSYLVIGRPITAAPSPKEAALSILSSLRN